MQQCLTQIEPMIRAATNAMTEQELVWHPEGKWSAANILEHLSMTYSSTAKLFDRILASGCVNPGRASAFQHFARITVTGVGYFPPGRKSPKVVEPTCTLGGKEALETAICALQRMNHAHERVEESFGNIGLADHPVLGPLTTKQWAKFHYVHARHHMKQIARLRAHSPSAAANA